MANFLFDEISFDDPAKKEAFIKGYMNADSNKFDSYDESVGEGNVRIAAAYRQGYLLGMMMNFDVTGFTQVNSEIPEISHIS